MAAVLAPLEEAARRRRVRNSAILWTLVAAGFYVAFVVMILVRGSK
jgi:predicted nucleic acid-binding Zn ribbon protein